MCGAAEPSISCISASISWASTLSARACSAAESARLRLDPGAFVAPGAVVVGDVTLGPRSSVWFNAVVRGDSAPVEIGEESNLQDLCVVHESYNFV